MKLKVLRIGIAAAGLTIAATLIAGVIKASGEFKINGNSVTTNFVTQSGRVYVPLADVATALDMQVVKHSDSSYELVAKGGANQVNGLEGKIGDSIRSSHFVLTVKDVQFTDHYTRRFTNNGVDDAEPGKTIVVFTMHLKNATPKDLGLSLSNGKTALTDDQEHSYEPFTGGYSDWNPNPDALPGSAVDFALVFTVPKGTMIKDLVYEIGADHVPKNEIFRIHVNQQAPSS